MSAAASLFNIIISGTSVSGDIDTSRSPVKLEMGNSDRIGHAHFELQNSTGTYTTLLLSGNATIQIDVVRNGIAYTLLRGTIEKTTNIIDAHLGSVTEIDAYDYGRELMNVISPDARLPYLQKSGTAGAIDILSGEGGTISPNGMDLASYVSGPNSLTSGPTINAFMTQWFGISGDFTGSQSGVLYSFKPYISGYTWKTWYYPDSSGGVWGNDKNTNFYLPPDSMKVKHEYAWDALRKITRQSLAVDSAGARVPMEMYIGVSGEIHLFTSGSYESIASGVTLIYYAAGQSGVANNNIISARIPVDLQPIKNVVEGYFPPWTIYPYDNLWSSILALSGSWWSGSINADGSGFLSFQWSGGPPSTNAGQNSIMPTFYSGPTGSIARMVFTLPGQTLSIKKFNAILSSGIGAGVSLVFNVFQYTTQQVPTSVTLNVRIVDTSGNFYGTTTDPNILTNVGSGWTFESLVIYGSGGYFNSGFWTPSATAADLTRINSIWFRPTVQAPNATNLTIGVDGLGFAFNYPFSPVRAFNSGSQGMYGRRYAVVEFPYEVSDTASSGLMTGELQGRMGSQAIANFVIKDNPNQAISAQLNIKPGYIFIVDAPALGTGSGQFFFYWRASEVVHEWSKRQGYLTTIKAYPWYSGTITNPNSNYLTYTTPMHYTDPPTHPVEREAYMPAGRPWGTGYPPRPRA